MKVSETQMKTLKWEEAVTFANNLYGDSVCQVNGKTIPLLMYAMLVAARLKTEEEQVAALLRFAVDFKEPHELEKDGIPFPIASASFKMQPYRKGREANSNLDQLRQMDLARKVEIAFMEQAIEQEESQFALGILHDRLNKLNDWSYPAAMGLVIDIASGRVRQVSSEGMIQFCDQYHQMVGIKLNSEQVNALTLAMNKPIVGIYGEKYTGVTQTLHAILALYKILDAKVSIAVVSGGSEPVQTYTEKGIKHPVIPYVPNELPNLQHLDVVVFHRSAQMQPDDVVKMLKSLESTTRVIFVDDKHEMKVNFSPSGTFAWSEVYGRMPSFELKQDVRGIKDNQESSGDMPMLTMHGTGQAFSFLKTMIEDLLQIPQNLLIQMEPADEFAADCCPF